MRAIAAVIAISVAVTLALRLDVTAANNDTTILGAAWISFRFFTIWTNTALGLVCGWIALGARPPQWMTAGLAMAIGLVAVVYHALLAASQSYEGIEVFIDLMFHTAIPAAFILFWLVLSPKRGLRWRDLLYWAAYPMVYCVYALARAAADGVYPYFFLNLDALGAGGVALWVMGLAGVFMAVGALLIAAVRVSNRGRHPA